MRKPGFALKNGYAVMSIPDSGLFVKDGRLVTGHQTEMKFDELLLFSRDQDAQKHAEENQKYWDNRGTGEHKWNFQVIPVLVSERL